MFWYLLITVITLVYVLQKYIYGYWQRKGVPGPKPKFLIGNIGENFLGKKSINNIYVDIYKEYRDHPFVGVYRCATPCLLVIDPDLLKHVTTKSFKHFHDNEVFFDQDADPLLGKNPFVLKGEEWKQIRNLLTPCFTSGKMKLVFPLLNDTGTKMTRHINEQIASGNMSYECKKLCTKFTLENVASCAFGLEGKCFEQPYSDFQDLANRLFSPGTWQSIKLALIKLFPSLTTVLKTRFVTADVDQQLRRLVNDTIDYRLKNKIERADFLQVMYQLSLTNPSFTNEDVVAHAAGFFVDGYETSSIVMSFFIYELACQTKIQTKLREEIQTSFIKNNGQFTYESIIEMEYLDACFNEAQRCYPILGAKLKTCTEDFSYTPTNTSQFKNISVKVEKGTPVILPQGGFFKDSVYFDEPDIFMPERFLNENKDKDHSKGVFKPFGDGPRSCLGQRFGTLQIKVGICHLLNNFKITFNEKTKIPLKFDPFYFMLSPIGGLWINFEKLDP